MNESWDEKMQVSMLLPAKIGAWQQLVCALAHPSHPVVCLVVVNEEIKVRDWMKVNDTRMTPAANGLHDAADSGADRQGWPGVAGAGWISRKGP